MQFPESWLRSFCNPPLDSQQLADALTMAGLEVEELRPVAPPFSKVVVGEIKSAAQHPNADRLRVCEVDVGQGALLNIVCGAPNARVGIKVPCALVGAELPPGDDGKPFTIKLGKLRGVESQGMLCSARELQLSESHEGLLELAADAVVGRDIREHLALDDMLFTLKLTPNLAHCLSVYGVAREVAAITGAPLQSPEFPAAPVSLSDTLPVRIEAPDLCGRFSGRVVRGVNTKAQTPAWMVDRLARCGQRSVTALVDISNYVMFELGRPSHIFDLDKIHGGLSVRWGREGESLKLLNGNTIAVDAGVGVIADDQAVESLAGIMGGDATAVSDDTRNIYIEAAFWWPKAVAGRSRRYNFSTDAGHRFERGVDPSTTVEHIERITQLVLEICGGQAGPMDDQRARLPESKPVTLRVARAAKVIGMPVTQAQCVHALSRLGLAVQEGEGSVSVTPPPYRFDLQIEEDLIEEVVRLIGYEQLPTTPPLAPITAKLRPEARRGAFDVRRQLAQLGYQETINFSFVEERWERELAGNADPIQLLNPIASQMSVMRSSLIGSLVAVCKFNLDRRAERVRLFEVGRVFRKDATVPDSDTSVAGFDQPMRVAGLAAGPLNALQWGESERTADFFDAKGDVEALLAPRRAEFRAAEHPAMHPGRSAAVWLDGRCIGHVGELHPRWRQAYELPQAPVLFELELEAVLVRPVPAFRAVSRHQPVQRDLALVVDESIPHDAVMAAIRGAGNPWLQDAVLFDVYRPKKGAVVPGLAEHEKSLAVRLIMNRDDGTLADEQIEAAVQQTLASLQQRVQARLRA
ncbi:MAG: phenylalanine--tRNA ligase subunit beta [Hydrogenophaga sp.]|uniref:phenylalanine--tRNA ligase subunit beta n=1 Tax=Hydrogenophaga sp. TaxID=1904254 RepID=UPI00169FD5FA|nr:phenylalanine--tRNA ligase subunit beta [Hydrogenophaga sp.]NIM43638.1 phenylalanine--tRNA ligase subunit beta [Hydrogenophaga sp.]NIN28707.1 phenylalanine--tRNA ligase subunit beta [Hydrogenophaga sp.]NIN33166.1 phenylalanine--tRNA ligase subunit beta [Hydrogenophaga sp.]NIN57841.1 phenylalanine--tRNA ligase subunit beta [Hydrogenophaga sp.]NIO54136.1 phenylalanine--tRNA ligase subunit beta [Hydrogenophaga sp.]